MAANYIRLPDDTLLTGKKVRTNDRVVGADTVHEHFMILTDITNDTQARVITSAPTTEAGLVVRNIPSGTQTVSGSVTASGTVTANQGTPASTANRWPVQLTDGTDLSLITAAGELNVLATAQPGVDIGDVTVNNASGGSAVNIQDGGNSITVDATSWPLPTGAATLAEQQTQTASLSVMDDWDETDRAKVNIIVGQAGITAGAGAVAANTPRVTHASDDPVTTSVQLLDDAIITDNAAFTDGTTKLNMAGFIFDETAGTALTENDAAAARLDSKRALVYVLEDETTRGRRATVTASNALKVDGSAVTQPVSQSTQSNLKAQVEGLNANGGAVTNPHMIAGKNLTSPTTMLTPTFYTAFGIDTMLVLQVGANSGLLNIHTTTGGAYTSGDTAHDAADAGFPVKIGFKVSDYEPVTSDVRSGGRTAVSAANDRCDASGNLYGETVEGVNGYFFTLDNISTTYNNTTTTATSTAKECWNYRQASFTYELTKANSPTDILFEFEVSLNNGSTFAVLQNDFQGDLRESAASVGSGIKKSVTFPIACHSIRVKATATGTTASATFTVANAVLYLRN